MPPLLTNRVITTLFIFLYIINAAVLPPPWANPKLNPCANEPRGWQLLYWPEDGKCYKIFQVGYPCPDGMELTPVKNKNGEEKLTAECHCPPKTAQSLKDGKCYELFTIGPCDVGYFYAPDQTSNKSTNSSKHEKGSCKQIKPCSDPTSIYWPKDGKCYKNLSRGPCPKGLLIIQNSDKIPTCDCDERKEFDNYRHNNGKCYEHFTRGPCWEKGDLFLPDRSCSCYSFLANYHQETEKCFEFDSIGPCSAGEIFKLDTEKQQSRCECKQGYIRYNNNSSCYRPFTQGPCPENHILLNTTSCIKQPCERGHLYFPKENRCYRIGTRGPCPRGSLVTFDFDTRPSVDGISYNGRCLCGRKGCNTNSIKCNAQKGMAKFRNTCYTLYTQGPCAKGAWFVPIRQRRQQLFSNESSSDRKGICDCMPNYKPRIRTLRNRNVTICVSPTVILADYLNKNFSLTEIVINRKIQ